MQTFIIVALLAAAVVYRIFFTAPPVNAGPDWKRRNIANTLAAFSLALVALSLVGMYGH